MNTTHERAENYESIEDWSVDGRRRLADARGDEIRRLLDDGFTALLDAERDVSLAAFGFRGDDPVVEAIEWSIDCFATREIDPSKLTPGSRSFRLFTEARFWLAQKAGKQGYRSILAATRAPHRRSHDEARTAAQPISEDVAHAFGAELAAALPGFHARTCADIVGFWLEGTKRVRRVWFSWEDSGELSDEAAVLSKKQRSFYAHDAMFRFLWCFCRLIPASQDESAERALELTCLSGCPNEPPYRVPDRLVVITLGLRGSREVSRLRKDGARHFLNACLDRVAHNRMFVPRDRFAVALTRKSLGPTTLHALGIEDDAALRARLAAVLAAEPEDIS